MASIEDSTPKWMIGRQPIITTNTAGTRNLTVPEAKKRLASYKGQITRYILATKKAESFATSVPSEEAIRSLDDILNAVTYHKEWVSELVVFLSCNDEAEAASYETVLTRAQDDFEACRNALVTAIVNTRKVIQPVRKAPSASTSTTSTP